MSQALYRKWRPGRFDEVVGQEHVTRTLKRALAAGRVGHAYLFSGPRGTGKTTSARLLAKAVNCLEPELSERPCDRCAACRAIGEGRFLDLIEIDAASNTGVDDIRDLREKINFSPGEGRYRVYIVDEVHMLSTAAFNALLKTLEEPPPHAIFVLATTEEHKVPLTIKSRCQQFNFRLLTVQEITGRLQWLAAQESLTIEPEALAMIAQYGAGSLRDAESLLDQLVSAPGDTITLERAQMVLGTASSAAVRQLAEAWIQGDGPGGLGVIHEALATGTDARQFARQMVTYLRQMLLLQTAGTELVFDAPAEQQQALAAQARQAGRAGLIEAVKRFNEAAVTPSGGWQPYLPLELAFIELLPEEGRRPVVVAPPVPKATEREPAVAPPLAARPEEAAEAAGGPEVEQRAENAEARRDGGALSLEAVVAHWREMVGRVAQQNRNLSALLNSGRPLAVEGQALVIGFDFPLLKEKFDGTARAGEVVAEALKQLLAAEWRVRAVVTGQFTPAAAGPEPVKKEQFYALADELGGVVREGGKQAG